MRVWCVWDFMHVSTCAHKHDDVHFYIHVTMCVYTCVLLGVCARVSTYVYKHVCLCVYMHVYIFILIFLSMDIFMPACICAKRVRLGGMCVHVCVCMHKYPTFGNGVGQRGWNRRLQE